MGNPNSTPTKSSVLKYTQSLVARAFVNILNECSTAVEDTQTIELQCDPDTSLGKQSGTFACNSCIAAVEHGFLSQAAIQRQVWNNGGKKEVVKPIATQFDEIAEQVKGCDLFCITCNFRDISQKAYLSLNQQCQINTASIANWQTQVRGQIIQNLYSRQDIAGALLATVNSSDADQTILNAADTVSRQLNANLANKILSDINLDQRVRLVSDTVAAFEGIHQDVLVSRVETLLAQDGLYSDALTNSQWQALQDNYRKDTTLDAFGNVIYQTVQDFSSIITSTLGGIVFGGLILLAAGTIVLIVLIVLKVTKT